MTRNETPGFDGANAAPIDVSNVSVSFGEVDVLEDVSFTVEPGELVGLIGPNGAGKTTLLRALSGALSPDRGCVRVAETDIHELSSRQSSRLVAVVPQDTTLSFSFDVRTVVEMGRYPHRSRFSPPDESDRTAVERALERTRTTEFADRSIDEVSGGERQRVVLARAIAQETPVLLLDEPTASLDVNHAIETLELVRDLVEDGRTVVAAIHDLNLAARYCDRLVMLSDGEIHREGVPESVLSSDAVRTAFDTNSAIVPNPVTGTPLVTALPEASNSTLPDAVHVAGCDDTASGILARLDAADVETSLGPVPSGATAAETAGHLGVDAIEVEPFAPVSRADRDAFDRRLADSDVAVIADLEVGAGNQVVLDRLLECEAIVLVETRPFSERNFAGDGARDRYERLRSRAIETAPGRVIEAIAAVSSVDRSAPPAGDDSVDWSQDGFSTDADRSQSELPADWTDD